MCNTAGEDKKLSSVSPSWVRATHMDAETSPMSLLAAPALGELPLLQCLALADTGQTQAGPCSPWISEPGNGVSSAIAAKRGSRAAKPTAFVTSAARTRLRWPRPLLLPPRTQQQLPAQAEGQTSRDPPRKSTV